MKPRSSRAKLPANAPRQSENSAVAGEIADRSEPTQPIQQQQPVQRQRDPAAGSDNRHQTIREAAYRRFEARGRVHGRDLEDWLEAEAQLGSSRDAKR